jgi:hypothetical protein
MNLGEIFYWTTEKAIGHESRPKYHIYVCPEDWQEGPTFLFVNSGKYGDDIEIKKASYGFLERDSFISCGLPVSYSEEELAAFNQKPVGKLTPEDLKKLFDAVADSESMEGWQVKRISVALQKA